MTPDAAKLSVVNLALAHLGEPLTETLDLDDASQAARTALGFIDTARDTVLSAHGWLRCLTYVTLPSNGEDGDFRFSYWINLPGDCLRIWEVDDTEARRPIRWEIGTRALDGEERAIIRSDTAPLDLAYVRRIGWDGLPSHLVNPIAALTASLTASPMQGDAGKAKALADRYKAELAAAVSQDGMQQREGPLLVQSGAWSLRQSVG